MWMRAVAVFVLRHIDRVVRPGSGAGSTEVPRRSADGDRSLGPSSGPCPASGRARRGYGGIAIIADQLDRIPRKQLNGYTNHENLFLDHVGALRGLNCDVLYTIPIELAYSRAHARLQDAYGSEILALPAVPVSTRDGGEFPAGVAVLREIVRRRADKAGVGLGEVFADPGMLDEVLCCSGGHIRGLFVMLQSILHRSAELPIKSGDHSAWAAARRCGSCRAVAPGGLGAAGARARVPRQGGGRSRCLERAAARPVRAGRRGRTRPLV